MKSIQYKLVRMLFLTSTLPLLCVAAITIVSISRFAVHDAQSRITTNLKISLDVYEKAKQNLQSITREQNRRVSTLLMDDQVELLRNEYRKIVAKNQFDFFIITDAGGTVIVSMLNPTLEGYNYSRDYLIRHAMRGETNVVTEVLGEYELSKFGLLQKARNPGISPTQGLLIRTSQPLINTNEIIVGTITAGYLLNNNTWLIIDPITAGTDFVSSVFAGDARIATNIISLESALGTHVDKEIADGVIQKGRNIAGRVLLHGKAYLAGYAPIFDFQGKPVGGLEIGIPESVVFGFRNMLLWLLSCAIVLAIVLSFIIGLRRGGMIARSIKALRQGVEAFGRGNLDYRVKVDSGDEIQELSEFYNRTIGQLQQTTRELELRSRDVVHLRHKISESSAQLEAVHKQLLEYERMAAIGRMASVINHELRNIFAEVQTSAAYLKTVIIKDPVKAAEYVDNIEHSIIYANEVLSRVLRISYPKRLTYGEVDMGVLVKSVFDDEHVSSLCKKDTLQVHVEAEQGLPKIKADGIQLREVFSILVVNAVQAMAGTGVLTVSVKGEGKSIIVEVGDTGKGIPPDVMAQLFIPFFTTKSRGLGLGLCLSKEIVKAHNGSLDVRTEQGKGTVFTVRLPVPL